MKTETLLETIQESKKPSVEDKVAAAVKKALAQPKIDEVIEGKIDAILNGSEFTSLIDDIACNILKTKEIKALIKTKLDKEIKNRLNDIVEDFVCNMHLGG